MKPALYLVGIVLAGALLNRYVIRQFWPASSSS